MMRTLLYQWLKVNSVILINAGSLIGATAVTSVLGFVYWLVAARLFPPEAVGFASAAISAMTLLGYICMFGLGTLLIGELPRQPGKEGSLISAALILVGGLGGCIGIVFAVVASSVSTQFQALGTNVLAIALFAVGVSFTSITLVLDQALIGLLRGELQLGRNSLFAVAKLGALFVSGLWLLYEGRMVIYATWLAGNVLSLVALVGFTASKGKWSSRSYLPHWKLLRQLKVAALQHHIVNLILQGSSLVLPVLVTAMLSATINAWFYVSMMIASFVFFVTYALTTVLYATNSAQPGMLAHQVRLTLSLALVACVLANCLLQFGTNQVLGLFGRDYAEQASWCLRILCFGAFPLIIKDHYVTLCRIQNRLAHTMLPIAAGTCLELGAAALGAHFGGLTGLSLGWFIAVFVESIFMLRRVYKVAVCISNSRDKIIDSKS
jgi:O-antigen/teichoic acid export membrane protein